MAEENRMSQAAVFLGAAALGIILMVVVPRQCKEKPAETTQKVLAPAPDPIGPRRTGTPTAPPVAEKPAVQEKLTLEGIAAFQSQAVALSQQPITEIGEALDDLMAKWALADPASAAAWVQQLPAGDFREIAGISLCQVWAQENPKDAAAWVTANLGNDQLRGALGAVAGVWALRDPDGVATWVAGLPETADRLAAEAGLAQTWGETNPAAAAAWLETLSPEHQGAALQNLLLGWSENDVAAAAAWLQGAITNNPKLPVGTAAVVVNAWSDKDAPAVSRWLNSIPEGPFYEAAATAFAQAAVEKSPKDALLWARSLGDPAQRQQSFVFAMETWMDKDRQGFVEALPKELEATSDPVLRKAIYDMLYRKDPEFQKSLLDLAETPDTPAPPTLKEPTPPAPATDQPAPGPVEASQPE